MGRGTNGAALAPAYDGAGSPADDDHKLVARVRRGDDRAFELLYERYHRRIHAYVLGMVKDHGRAEDVTQEVFVSALRRMRETEQPLAFKPWLYQIAKNSCIDAFRRSKRAEEVSYDADDALAPSDHSRLVGSGPSPDAAVAAKQDLESLCGAFGGLSETHHEILVLRELEGLSYQEIGRRMGMSRPAVESTLFRARRRLTEEYDDIVSGARCQRIQGIIVMAAQSRLGTRDTRRLARHLAHCQPCRREALAAGLDRNLFARPTVRERVATKVAGMLPFPILARFRRGAEDASAGAPPSGRGAAFMAHLPIFAEQGWGKAAAGAAVLVAGVGAGVGVHHQQSSAAKAPVVREASSPVKAANTTPFKPASAGPTVAADSSAPAGAGQARTSTSTRKVANGKKVPAASGVNRTTSLGGGGTAGPAPTKSTTQQRETSASSKRSGSSGSGSGSDSKSPKLPGVTIPVDTDDTTTQASDAITKTGDAVKQTTDAVKNAAGEVTEGVDQTVTGVTGGGPVSGGVDKITDDADNTVSTVTDGVNKTIDQTTGTVKGIVGSGG